MWQFIFFVGITIIVAARCEAQQLSYGIVLGGDLARETGGAESFEPGNAFYNFARASTSHSFMKTGYIGGFELDYGLSRIFALSGSVLFDQKGVSISYPYTTEASPEPTALDTEEIELNYLEIPLLAKWSPNAFFLFAGPSFGILLSGRIQSEPTAQGGSYLHHFALSQKTQPSVSAIAGVGFAFKFSPKVRGEISAAYAYGLTNDSFDWNWPYSTGPQPKPYQAEARDVRLTFSILLQQ